MENYRSPKLSEKPEKKIKPIANGKVTRQRKPLGKRIAETFFSDDSKNVGDFLFWDVLIPSAKETVFEMITKGAGMALFSEDRGTAPKKKDKNGMTYYAYDSISKTGPARSSRSRSRMNFDDIILDSKYEAEEILSQMYDILEAYQVVTVADLYEMAKIPRKRTDYGYGWTSLTGSKVQHVRTGWLIDLPSPEELD